MPTIACNVYYKEESNEFLQSLGHGVFYDLGCI
jgi:hypothetical protein